MVINIQNVLRTTHLNYTALASATCGWDHIAQLDFYDYLHCMEQSLCTAAVTVDKTVKGVCVCSRSLIPDSCEIELLCIDQAFRRKGLGRKLLSHALRNMRTLRIRAAFLWVNETNSAAISFFTGFGFTPDGKRRPSRTSIHGEELRFKIDIY